MIEFAKGRFPTRGEGKSSGNDDRDAYAALGRSLRGSLCRLLKRNGFRSNRCFALAYCSSMIFSDLPSPAEASNERQTVPGFAQAGNRYPLFGIML